MSLRKKVSILTGVIGIVCAVVVLSALIGCGSLQPNGNLVLHVGEQMGIRNIEPPLDMDIVKYICSISGEQDFDFEINKPDSSYSINRMPTGAYTIQVSAQNDESFEVGYGSESFLVEVGQTTSVSVTIIPLTGEGTLSIDIDWDPADLVGTPGVESLLAPVSTMIPADISMDYTVSASGTIYSETWGTGWYLLLYQLDDDGAVIWGFADAVRIVKDQTSSGVKTLTIDDINGVVGGIDLSIFEDMDSPIDIILDGVSENLPSTQDMVVTAVPSETVDSYAWYLNGTLQAETSNTITIGAALPIGNYRLDAVVRKANVLSAEGAAFHVVEDAVINIPDDGLYDALITALGKTMGDDIYQSELASLVNLNSNGIDIYSLTGLEYCISLVHLDCSNNHVSDLSPIAGLTQLTYIHMNVNPTLSDLSPLANLTNLTNLEIIDDPSLQDLQGLVDACDNGLTGCTIGVSQSYLNSNAVNVQVPYIQAAGNTVNLF